YNRISRTPILLHSQVYAPDAVIVVDPSIISEDNNAVVRGLKSGGFLVINTARSNIISSLRVPEGCSVYLVDATSICLELDLQVAGLEVLAMPMLGAFAKATSLVSLKSLEESITSSFEAELAKKNVDAVVKAYESTRKAHLMPEQYVPPVPPSKPIRIPEIHHWTDLPPVPVSTPSKGSIGNTGDWRTRKPVIDKEKCNKCLFCWMYCPEATINIDDSGFPQIDYNYCKGCEVCFNECPRKAISMVVEEK
ncbi:MAG: 2-oxoacid:acceptor oxidoreductase family protein, partial [Candidatus Jordarchaeales archaeon]